MAGFSYTAAIVGTLLVVFSSPARAQCPGGTTCSKGFSGAKCCLSPNSSSRSTPIEHIVMHYTAGADSASLSWLNNPSSGVSAHYLVMRNGSLYQLVDETRQAWHAGVSKWGSRSSINGYSIGIEIVNDGSGSQDYLESQYQHLINLCKYLVTTYNIKKWNVVGHSDIAGDADTGKTGRKPDPGNWFDWKRLYENDCGLWVQPAPLVPGDAGLTSGASGSRVTHLQTQLMKYGYAWLSADGQYGPITAASVKEFQRHFRPARVDGRADNSTFDTLDSLVAAKGV